MSSRAPRVAVVVTGTEVLTGRVLDANGPWLAGQLRGIGADIGRIVIVGDRPDDLAGTIDGLADHDLIITSGGLGPTADDLTAQVVADLYGRPMHREGGLEERIAAVVRRLAERRGWTASADDLAAGVRKQALVPDGADWLDPVGTAPGLVIPGDDHRPPLLVLPGPPGELRPMWTDAIARQQIRDVLGLDGDTPVRESIVRLWGPPEAALAGLLRDLDAGRTAAAGPGLLDDLEITTCLRDDGELEVVTRHSPEDQPAADALTAALRERFGAAVFVVAGDDDGRPRTLDELVARRLVDAGATVATAESCTAGLLAARLADRPGSSAYLRGGLVVYDNALKTGLAGVPADLLDRHGAVSAEVALALARGARDRCRATYGIGVTGIAGPDGGTETKPVGLVHLGLAGPDGEHPRELRLGGDRAAVRSRTVTRALHLLREQLPEPTR